MVFGKMLISLISPKTLKLHSQVLSKHIKPSYYNEKCSQFFPTAEVHCSPSAISLEEWWDQPSFFMKNTIHGYRIALSTESRIFTLILNLFSSAYLMMVPFEACRNKDSSKELRLMYSYHSECNYRTKTSHDSTLGFIRGSSTDHKRIWSHCVCQINPHVKQRLETLLILSPIHSLSSFCFPLSTVLIVLCFHLYLILISESNTCNKELQVIFLRLFQAWISLISIFPYFSEMDFDQLTHEEIWLKFPRCSSQLYVFIFRNAVTGFLNLDS